MIVEQLLQDTAIRRYTRIGGLFTLLFAQPLSRIVAMRTSQVTVADDTVEVAFSTLPDPDAGSPRRPDPRTPRSPRQEPLCLTRHRLAIPRRQPRPTPRHREHPGQAQLVAIGIKPYENRKATLFQLAGDIPAPVLAELIGISNDNAADWARLAARDWSGYIADRAR